MSAEQIRLSDSKAAVERKKRVAVSSGDLISALMKRYPEPAFAFFEQVAPGTGSHATRFSDAMAMSLWPSRGLELTGFEIKVSRHDWMRELRNPEKADKLSEKCHRWYVVAPAGLIELSEIPAEWGLFEFRGGKLFTTKEAPRRAAPEPTWHFLAAILRRASEATVPKSAVDTTVKDLIEKERAALEDRIERRHSSARDRVTCFHAFEEALGEKIHNDDQGKRLGEELARLRLLDAEPVRRQMRWTRDTILAALRLVDAAIKGKPEDCAVEEET